MEERSRAPTVAVVLEPDLRGQAGEPHRRSAAERLVEAEGLARAIDLDITHSAIVPVARPQPATLLGRGKVEEIAGVVKALEAGLVIVDHALTPVQQRNLEKEWNAKVLDRTALILEIFGRRAQTREGTLQVELAHLNYQRGRLVRSWTHLERQRGGAGFLGGPGETQIEADRRILRDKIKRIERELEAVRRTRTLHRSKRKKVPLPVVSLVGYTNAGKSTLFNRLTGAGVTAEDMLFATLDPTLRRVRLPGGTWIILSDTVGFISDLPTHLVAAFRATLEEVQEAEIVLHLRDISSDASREEASDVAQILSDLDVDPEDERHVIEVWNKIDSLDPVARADMLARAEGTVSGPAVIPVSAVTGEGIDRLLMEIEDRVSGALVVRRFSIPPDRYGDVAWLYDHGHVRHRESAEDGSIVVDVELTAENAAAFDRR
ncbi:GTPase HflX [Oricola thermophila]|uniref:GTPase HflX n=1 Tax=Oricola thermophila TaxID=2742145 RepID=A0A6N1VL69_9HYPH|nr:GTPase HflX [Oricola thermophila]QKV20565.1 GTPase HflX [Oricola thermophila]